ncbi:MAG: helix-turn-helix transcriptional regulator [Clostridia bacterium]|nr:helix-turn-helix transcriptional regulator [Clostridia bacterium]
MSLVTQKNQQPAFAPLVQKLLVAERHSLIRTDKQVAYAHQPYSSLQSVLDRIRWLRLQRRITQKEAAEMVGIGRANYVDYEAGTIERFDPAVIKRIAELYEVPVTDLLDHYNAFLISGQGEQVRQWRISLGKNYKEMGEYLGVATSNVISWEQEEKIMTKKLYERCFGFNRVRKD